jgi:hypothetical protein
LISKEADNNSSTLVLELSRIDNTVDSVDADIEPTMYVR